MYRLEPISSIPRLQREAREQAVWVRVTWIRASDLDVRARAFYCCDVTRHQSDHSGREGGV